MKTSVMSSELDPQAIIHSLTNAQAPVDMATIIEMPSFKGKCLLTAVTHGRGHTSQPFRNLGAAKAAFTKLFGFKGEWT